MCILLDATSPLCFSLIEVSYVMPQDRRPLSSNINAPSMFGSSTVFTELSPTEGLSCVHLAISTYSKSVSNLPSTPFL